jgi:hypothetical protein
VEHGRTETITKGILHRILIVVGATLLIGSAAVSEPPPPTIFETACLELRLDCSKLPPPVVVYTKDPFILQGNNLGVYYPDTATIYVNSSRWLVAHEQIEMHETVHYILDHLAPTTRCKSEETARVVTARVFNREVDKQWRVRYQCPRAL